MKNILGLAAVVVGGYVLYEWYKGNSVSTATQTSVNANSARRDSTVASATTASERSQQRAYAMRGLGQIAFYTTRSNMLYTAPVINGRREPTIAKNSGEILLSKVVGYA